jgi:tetratricopeptide (TPR) repeat protein
MRTDARGLLLSTDQDAAASAFDAAIAVYLRFRTGLPALVTTILEADPDFALGHCLAGIAAMLAYDARLLPAAAAALARAQAAAPGATLREQTHIAALAAWVAGDVGRAVGIWEAILADHPRDVLAFRLAHFGNFALGRPQDMVASVRRILPHWDDATPGFPAVLACQCFAEEEAGNLLVAEPIGRRAITLDPGDIWAAHAVAHVLETQGRRREGIDWLTGLAAHWEGASNLVHHLWWHVSLFHLEQGGFDTVLDLYDRRFRNLGSRLTQAIPDLYTDVQNAASMLFRLERLGVAVGRRWEELADKAEARIGDCLATFTLPHWMMALAAGGRERAAERMLAALRERGQGEGAAATVLREVALPVCEAVRAHRAGAYAACVAGLRPVLGAMHRLGGSHAQQDVLHQLFLDAALRAGIEADVRLALERAAGRRTVPLSRWIGYRDAAARFPL